MPPSALLERGSPPTQAELREMLGRSCALWTQLHAALSSQFAPLSEKWSYAGKAYGWSLQLKQKKRTVLYMIPCPGHFVASFALGDKAGRGVRLEVRNRKALLQVRRLATLKMSN